MPQQQLKVTFEPHGRVVFVLPGTTILEAAGRAGLTIDTPCGGEGTCGKCRLRITSGACEPTAVQQDAFSADQLQEGWRLACQTAVTAETVAVIPQDSLFARRHQILTQAKVSTRQVVPAVRKEYVELPHPTLDDGAADLLRLEKQVGPLKADLPLLRRLSGMLREGDFKGTAVLANHHLIDFEQGDTTDRCFGVAFDIGTTTLVASLLDLGDGSEQAVIARMNPQVRFGDDVLSRITCCQDSADGYEQLRREIVTTVGEMIEQLCRESGVAGRHIYEVTFAGNTTMQHLLCGLDVVQLGQVPFVPAHGRGLVLTANDLEIQVHPRASVYIFPVIGGFVGGDTVAGMLAADLSDCDGPVLLVDVGTNGEIVLWAGDQLWAASTAAGPAFEGARISCGMRAAEGAIEKIVFDDDVQLSVIGGGEATGLCGSAMVDVAAALLGCGIVSPMGRLLPADELPEGVGQALRRRVVVDTDGRTEFVLVDGADGAKRITLTECDVRELQLATGAIRAGISILLRRAEVTAGQLTLVLIAGGFGSFIRRSGAQAIGLLPADVDHRRIHYVGNASLSGAQCALISTDARKLAERIARDTRHVELSQDPNFQMEFAEAMIFPPRKS